MDEDLYGSDEFEVEPTVVMKAFAPGAFFGDKFRIDRLVGAGGMSSVYDARDLQTDQRVALKVLKKSKVGDEAAERFRREAEILSRIPHPGVVGIHGFGQAPDGTLWMAMELLDGESLRDRVHKGGPMEPADLVPILAAAAETLEAAHSEGIIHRDLKPDHIFIPASRTPLVKILDFGLSLIAGSAKLTATGTVLGTPRYMAPEQIASAHNSDEQADVYALGVIIYEALAGHSPFAASDHGQLLGAILQGRIQPLREIRPDVSEAIVNVVERAMAPQTGERYKSPTEFAQAYAGAVDGVDPGRISRPSDPEQRSTPSFTPVPDASERAKRLQAEAQKVLAEPVEPAPTWLLAVMFFAGMAMAAATAWGCYLLLR